MIPREVSTHMLECRQVKREHEHRCQISGSRFIWKCLKRHKLLYPAAWGTITNVQTQKMLLEVSPHGKFSVSWTPTTVVVREGKIRYSRWESVGLRGLEECHVWLPKVQQVGLAWLAMICDGMPVLLLLLPPLPGYKHNLNLRKMLLEVSGQIVLFRSLPSISC